MIECDLSSSESFENVAPHIIKLATKEICSPLCTPEFGTGDDLTQEIEVPLITKEGNYLEGKEGGIYSDHMSLEGLVRKTLSTLMVEEFGDGTKVSITLPPGGLRELSMRVDEVFKMRPVHGDMIDEGDIPTQALTSGIDNIEYENNNLVDLGPYPLNGIEIRRAYRLRDQVALSQQNDRMQRYHQLLKAYWSGDFDAFIGEIGALNDRIISSSHWLMSHCESHKIPLPNHGHVFQEDLPEKTHDELIEDLEWAEFVEPEASEAELYFEQFIPDRFRHSEKYLWAVRFEKPNEDTNDISDLSDLYNGLAFNNLLLEKLLILYYFGKSDQANKSLGNTAGSKFKMYEEELLIVIQAQCQSIQHINSNIILEKDHLKKGNRETDN